jgi:hypothetical protein
METASSPAPLSGGMPTMFPLLDLPDDIYRMVIDTIVRDAELPELFRLRGVCSTYIVCSYWGAVVEEQD